jgi:cell division protein FtsA
MFDPSSIIVGLEIGTSKVCAVVGEVNAAGALNIVGVGQARSRGVRKGEIADASAAAEDVRNAVVEAEQMADVEIRSVYLGVSGGHLRGLTNRGVHPVVSADREITKDDVDDVIRNAKAINLPAENHVVHAIRQHFLVDGHDGLTDPIGMLGARVEDMHVIHGIFNRCKTRPRGHGLVEVDAIVRNGLASSLALLTTEEGNGAPVLDMGWHDGYVAYSSGIIKHAGRRRRRRSCVNDLAWGPNPAGRQNSPRCSTAPLPRRAARRGNPLPATTIRRPFKSATLSICAASWRWWRRPSGIEGGAAQLGC